MLLPGFNHTVNLTLIALALLVLPGAGWMVWSRRLPAFPLWLADSVGISVSFWVLAWLASYFIKFNFGFSQLQWIFVLLLSLLGLGILYQILRYRPRITGKSTLVVLITLIVVSAGIYWRLRQAQGLAFPLWVDSVHHALIIRVFQAEGHLVGTLKPLLNVPFAYHYGFHALTAMAGTLSGEATSDTMLWFGQVINALIGLSVYRLVFTLWSDWKRALLAALIVTFALQMPAYYLTWGRYTLSIGLVILPLTMSALINFLRQPKFFRWVEVLVLTAGVALCHLTTFYLFGIFTILALVVYAFQKKGSSLKETSGRKWVSFAAAMLALFNGVALTSPWLYRILGAYPAQMRVGTFPVDIRTQSSYLKYIWSLLGPNSSYLWLILGGMGLLWALFRRDSRLISFWGLLAALMVIPWGLRIGPFRADHMAIVLFLPICIFSADLLVRLAETAPNFNKPALSWFAWGVLVICGAAGLVIGARDNVSVINPGTVIADSNDRQALDWVAANLAPDASFVINTAFWMGTTYRGVDGGYWLLPYTARQTVLPPSFYTFFRPDEVDDINSRAKTISTATTCDAAFNEVLAEAHAGYVYIHQGKGGLQPETLDRCPNLLPIFRQFDVVIYQVLPLDN